MKREISVMMVLFVLAIVVIVAMSFYIAISAYNITEGYIVEKGIWGRHIKIYEDDELVQVICYEDTKFWIKVKSGNFHKYITVSEPLWNYYNVSDYYQGSG